MIERTCDDEITICCDALGCTDSYACGTADFRDAIQIIKEEDWLITKERGEWEHFCLYCKDFV